MKKVMAEMKRTLSVLLAVAMIVTMVPQTSAVTYAAELDDEIVQEAISETETNTDDPAAFEDGDADEAVVSETENVDDETVSEDENADDADAVSEESEAVEVGKTVTADNVVLAEDDQTEETTAELTDDNTTVTLKLNGEEVTDGIPYTGSEIKPEVTVSYTADGEESEESSEAITLNADSDYTVAYQRDGEATDDLTTLGEITVVVTAAENSSYTGSVSAAYEIVKGEAPAQVETGITVDADGSDSEQVVLAEIEDIFDEETYGTPTYSLGDNAVSDEDGILGADSVTLDEGVLTFSVAGGEAGKTATITVTADFDNYESSSIVVTVTLKAVTSLEDAEVTLKLDGEEVPETGVVYSGNENEPEVEVKLGENTVDAEAYEITYSDDTVNVGTVTVTVTAKAESEYKGSASAEFEIVALDLDEAEDVVLALTEDAFTYTGEEIKPEVDKVTVGGKEVNLAETDYELAYANNTDAAAADSEYAPTVTLKGTEDNVIGSVTANFTINKAEAPALIAEAPTYHAKYDESEEFAINLADFFDVSKAEAEYEAVVSDDDNVLSAAYDVEDSEDKAKYAIEDGVLKVTTAEQENYSALSATVKVTASYQNYEDAELTVTVQLEEKKWITISGVSVSDKVYDGEQIAVDGEVEYVDNQGDAPENVELIKEFYSIDNSENALEEAPYAAGQYKYVITVDSEDYTGSLEIEFEISKATVTVTANDVVIKVGQEVPAEDTLSYTIEGLAERDWADEDVALATSPARKYYDGGNEIAASAIDNETAKAYTIAISGAAIKDDAAANYEDIVYVGGTFTIKDINGYTVTFDLNYADAENSVYKTVKVEAGDLIEWTDDLWLSNAGVSRDGYRFFDWYKDAACTKIWNFDTDTVQEDTTLYALWLTEAVDSNTIGAALSVQEIPDQVYTGSAIKPAVKVYDEWTLLTTKNYTITYKNNTNVAKAAEGEPAGGVSTTGVTDAETGFNANLPYVIIKGKGNYTDTLYVNFNIVPASIGDGEVASGVTLKYNDQLTISTKTQKPVSSLKYKKAMKEGTDYTITLEQTVNEETTVNVSTVTEVVNGKTKITAALIPANASGAITLTITGIGNYTGTITKTIQVADKTQLVKNASISLGSKSVAFTGEAFEFTPAVIDGKAYYPVVDGAVNTETELTKDEKKTAFTVKLNKVSLVAGRDIDVSYANNTNVGTATLTITGKANENDDAVYCVGTKSVTFKITGTKFTAAAAKNPKPGTINVEGLETSVTYTGSAQTQNDVVLTVVPAAGEENIRTLVFGQDYTITYKNNVKKGTATMTFTATPQSGYTGSFKKTFKIGVADLTEVVTDVTAMIPEYQKLEWNSNGWFDWVAAGGDSETLYTRTVETDSAVSNLIISEDIVYTAAGASPSIALKVGDTELVAGTDYTIKYTNNSKIADADAAKAPTITIKGKGGYSGTLTIKYNIVQSDMTNLNVEVASKVAFNSSKADDYKYQPKIKVTNNGKALSTKDYEIEFWGTTQANIREWLAGNEGQTIDGVYIGEPTVTITLKPTSIYYCTNPDWSEEQLAKANTIADWKIGDAFYETKLTTKNLAVYVSNNLDEITYNGGQVTPSVSVYYKESNGYYTYLTEGDDYTVSYGANNTAGKNKGSVTVTGKGIYTGSVTVKFTILSKAVYNNPIDISSEDVVVSLWSSDWTDGRSYTDAEGYYHYVVDPGTAVNEGITPEVDVYYSSSSAYKWLWKDADYTLSWQNNTALSTEEQKASVTITAIDGTRCIESKTIEFVIEEGTYVSECDVTISINGVVLEKNDAGQYVYYTESGYIESFKNFNLGVTVEKDGVALVRNDDYHLNWDISGTGGTVTVIALGNGWLGEEVKEVVVAKAGGEDAGDEEEAPVTISENDVTLYAPDDENMETALEAGENGIYTITVDSVDNENPVKPLVKVSVSGNDLTVDEDYTITYAGNTSETDTDADEIAYATVTVSAADGSSYAGSVEFRFVIKVAENNDGEDTTEDGESTETGTGSSEDNTDTSQEGESSSN